MATGPSNSQLITAITEDVKIYFQNPSFDASHDFVHVQRVVALAKRIFIEQEAAQKEENHHQIDVDESVVVLGALLHDVADHKYQQDDPSMKLVTAESLLLKHGADPAIARKIQTIVTNVSYTNETKNPENVASLCKSIPELAIVQDADRLDAIGAVGVGRCFTFGGAKGRDLDDTVGHFSVKLLRLEGKMKTEAGRRMAAQRTKRLREFLEWWNDERSILD